MKSLVDVNYFVEALKACEFSQECGFFHIFPVPVSDRKWFHFKTK